MKIKEVKTVITVTCGTALVYDEGIKNVYNEDFEIKATFKTTDGMEKMVREYFAESGRALVKVNEVTKVKATYSIPIDVFMEYAKEVERVC